MRFVIFSNFMVIAALVAPSAEAASGAAPWPGSIPLADSGFETPYAGPAGVWGSFTYPQSGSAWSFVSAGISANGSGYTDGNGDAPEGGQVAFIQRSGQISQSVQLPAGVYRLIFHTAQRVNCQSSFLILRVLVDGQDLHMLAPTTFYSNYVTPTFAVKAGAHVITFAGLNPSGGDNTVFLDNVFVWPDASYDLAVHWKLDDGSAISALDSSGHGNTGNMIGGPEWSAGVKDGALSFDGVDDVVVAADAPSLRLTRDCTFAFWMRKDAEAGDWQRLLGKGDQVRRQFGIWEEAGAGKRILFQQYSDDGTPIINLFSHATVEIGAWYHIACTIHNSSVGIYVNGTLDVMDERSGTPATSSDPLTLAYGTFHTYFPGSLDDVRIYNRALSADEIAALMVDRIPPLGGGFEENYLGNQAYLYSPSGTPWIFSNAGIASNDSGFTAGNPDAPEGLQVAFLQSYGHFGRAVNLPAGTYSVSFKAAQRAGCQDSWQSFEVYVDGSRVGTFTPAGTGYETMSTVSFTVGAGAHHLLFRGVNPNGGDNTALIDAIELAPAGMPAGNG